MIFSLRRLGELLGLSPKPEPDKTDESYEQLRAANDLATQHRRAKDRRTGNVAADYVTGTYVPRQRSER